MKKTRIVILIVILVCSHTLTAVLVYNATMRYADHKAVANEFVIGKSTTVIVKATDKVDSAAIRDGLYGFDFIDERVCENLARYMRNRNLVVRPGAYDLNQADTFEDCLAKLSFLNTGSDEYRRLSQ